MSTGKGVHALADSTGRLAPLHRLVPGSHAADGKVEQVDGACRPSMRSNDADISQSHW